MKRSLILTFLLLLLTFGIANANNTVEVMWLTFDKDYVAGETIGNTISGEGQCVVGWENDVLLQGASVGLVVKTTGTVAVKFVYDTIQLTPYPIFDGGEVFTTFRGATGLGWSFGAFGAESDTVLCGGAWNPGSGLYGVDAGAMDAAYYHRFEILSSSLGATVSEICIDSVPLAGAAGYWVFDDGSGNINPTFNNGNGPICWNYDLIPCQAPAFTTVPAGDVLAGPHCSGVSFTFAADPVEDGESLTGFAVVDGGGLTASFSGAAFTAQPADPGDYTVTVSVGNTCPATTTYTFTVTLTNAGLQYTACPTAVKQVSQGKTFTWDLGLDNFDCDAITETVTIITNPTGSTPDVSVVDGEFTFNSTSADVGIWTFQVCGADPFGEEECCEFQVEVTATSTFGVRIAKIGDEEFVFQGHYTYLPIYLDYSSPEEAIGGFDFLIAYDASALTFILAEAGEAIDCWEYFTYRDGPFGNCDGACPNGLLNVIAMAEANDGPNHPSGCDGEDGFFDPEAELVKIKFFVTSDATYECQYVPVYFYWLACQDNAISDWSGNDLYVSNHVYNINWVDVNNPYYELVPGDGTIDENDHIYGTWDECIVPNGDKPVPIRDVDFFNGGVDIACADSIDARGDINLNNVANEIADAVLYTNYFIYGPSVFVTNLEGQIAASDVNNDGRTLTVGDLVYLIRILTGDATAYDKLSPFAQDATVRMSNGVVSLNSGVNVGAILFTFEGEGEVTLLANNMEIVSDVVNGETKALVWSRSTESIEAGLNNVISVSGDITLTEAEVSDYYGNMVSASVVTKIVPKAYALNQNYPNPFNPTTEVAFDLPESANWTLGVYNIAGQLVKSYSGYNDAGTVRLSIDGNGWASGIYFYKLQANDFVQTKKMSLVK